MSDTATGYEGVDASKLFGDTLPTATQEQLKTVSDMVAASLELERLIEEAQNAVSTLQERKRRVDEVELPDAMHKAGTMSFTNEDGTVKVEVENKVYANISADRKEPAHEWLRGNGHESLIKSEFRIPFKKGSDAEAKKLESQLKKMGVEYAKTETVNSQTLQAFAREQVQAGKPFPLTLFGVHIQRIANIKQVKPKKGK